MPSINSGAQSALAVPPPRERAPTVFVNKAVRVEVLDGGLVRSVFVEEQRVMTDSGIVEAQHDVALKKIMPLQEVEAYIGLLQQALAQARGENADAANPMLN